jgi:hypothetical protein
VLFECTIVRAMGRTANRLKVQCCNAGYLGTWFWTFSMELTYEILGIRPLLIDKLNNAPISRS